jgi:sulfur transfer complex TusBCD TusB component (DsrH family)
MKALGATVVTPDFIARGYCAEILEYLNIDSVIRIEVTHFPSQN